MARHRIEIERELFKFSCAHMTVFPDGSKERLHGHNYYVGVALELSRVSFADMVPFAPLKAATIQLCRELREHLLLAADNPHFRIVGESPEELEFTLCGARYVVPREDVILLAIDNVSVEALAEYLARRLLQEVGSHLPADVVRTLEVRVTESPGQGSVCILPIEPAPESVSRPSD